MKLYRIVTRWACNTGTPEGAQRLTFDRVHYREAESLRLARKAEHAHNRTRIEGSPEAEEFAADGWRYRIVSARAVNPEAATVQAAKASGDFYPAGAAN